MYDVEKEKVIIIIIIIIIYKYIQEREVCVSSLFSFSMQYLDDDDTQDAAAS